MSESSPAKEVMDGMRTVFDRIGEFFHLFDLSFFVSGTTAFSAVFFLYFRSGAPRTFPLPDWIGVLALIVACYVCGLMAFAFGRMLNNWFFRAPLLRKRLEAALRAHQRECTYDAYLGAAVDLNRLYIRLWAEVSRDRTPATRMSVLHRYWVMAATYDGLAFAFLVWAAVLGLEASPRLVPQAFDPAFATATAGVCVVLAVVAFRQGANYYAYQIEDLAAGLAAAKADFMACGVLGSPPRVT